MRLPQRHVNFVILAIASVAVACVLYGLWPSGRLTAQSPAPSTGHVDWPVPAAAEAFEVSLALRFEARPASGEPPSVQDFSLNGKWSTSIVERDARTTRRVGQLSAIQATPANIAAPAVLGVPVYADYDQEGRITQVHLPPGLTGVSRSVIASLWAAGQMVRPAGGADEWTTLEPDATGVAQMKYKCVEAGCTKQRLAYKRPSGLKRGAPDTTPKVLSSRIGVDLQGGRLLAIAQDEWISVSPPGLEITAGLKVTMKRSSSPAVALAGPIPAEFIASDLWTTPKALAAPSGPVASIAGRLKALEGHITAGHESARADAENALVQLFRGDGRTIDEAVQWIKRGGPASGAIVGAMVRSGTQEAEAGVRQVIPDRTIPMEARERALQGLALWPSPQAETVAAVRGEIDDSNPAWRKAALYTYGANAGHLGQSDQARAERIVEELGGRLNNAQTSEERQIHTAALGNTASPAALQWLSEAAKASAIDERANAIRALRLIHTVEAQQIIAQALTTDPAAEVRAAALFAIEAQPLLPFLQALRHLCEREQEASLRTSAVHILGKGLAETPEADLLLEYVATHDAEPEVRRLAASMRVRGGLLGSR